MTETAPRLSDAQAVKAAARDRWPSILPALGIPSESLRDRHRPCPGCGGRDRFRFDDEGGDGTFICSQGGGDPAAGDGFALLQHVNGWTFTEALSAVAEALGMDGETPPPRPKPKPAKDDSQRKRRTLRRVWQESRPIRQATTALPVAYYFKRRGLGMALWGMPDDLRFHPELGYWEPGEPPQLLGNFPAMLAVVRGPDGQPVTLHRTYLTNDGQKAPVESPRKLMPPPVDRATKGGAVRLYPAGSTLAVAEGLETALAVHFATGWPVWATISATGMQAVEVPLDVEDLVVCADHDRAGLEAAEALAHRESHRARVAVPPEPGMDWADTIQGGGHGPA